MNRLVPFKKEYKNRKYTPVFDELLEANLSDHAKILYLHMYRRLMLSCQEGNISKYSDEKGIFILMSLKEMAEYLHRKTDTANNIKNELIKAGWIVKERQGCKESNIYRINIPESSIVLGK